MRCGADQSGKKTKLTPLSEEGQAIVTALNLSIGSKIDQVSADMKAVNNKVGKANERIDNHEERIAKLEVRATANHARSAPESSHVVVPREARTIAVIGNLGWDTPRSVIMERAKQVFTDAGVSPESFSSLCAITFKDDKGSTAQLCFNQPAQLQVAGLAVRALNRTYQQGRYVFLDVRKELSEWRPGQIVRRMADFLGDVEAARTDRLEIKPFMNGKFVKVGGDRVGFTFKGEWKWTQFAVTRFSREIMETAKEYAEGE